MHCLNTLASTHALVPLGSIAATHSTWTAFEDNMKIAGGAEGWVQTSCNLQLCFEGLALAGHHFPCPYRKDCFSLSLSTYFCTAPAVIRNTLWLTLSRDRAFSVIAHRLRNALSQDSHRITSLTQRRYVKTEHFRQAFDESPLQTTNAFTVFYFYCFYIFIILKL